VEKHHPFEKPAQKDRLSRLSGIGMLDGLQPGKYEEKCGEADKI
jgi:hypothetical protein